jgi:hypothetical protein
MPSSLPVGAYSTVFALADAFGQLNVNGGQGGPVNPPATAALVLAAYVIGSMAIAAAFFMRRDVT